jgi:uracil-DNA glycosylase family 4
MKQREKEDVSGAVEPADRRPPPADAGPCWRGKGDLQPLVPGLPAVVAPARSLGELFTRMACCTRCELAAERTQVVRGVGRPSARLMFIGEAPGAAEDRTGIPFVGRAGKLLDRLLADNRIVRDEIYITNVVACRPPGNRAPRSREVQAHAPWLEEQIRLVQPELIVTLGRPALTYFEPRAKITEVRGWPREFRRGSRSFRLLPLFHPAAVLRRRELLALFERDFATIPVLLG